MTETTTPPTAAPWWHSRKPRTDAERMELLALDYQENPEQELALAVRDGLPELWARWPAEKRLAAEDYAKRRDAACQLAGRPLPRPDPAVVAELRLAWAQLNEATPGDPAAVNRRARDAFRQSVTRGGNALEAHLAWCRALGHEHRLLARYVMLRHRLGLGQPDLPSFVLPVFTTEWQRAVADDVAGRLVAEPVD